MASRKPSARKVTSRKVARTASKPAFETIAGAGEVGRWSALAQARRKRGSRCNTSRALTPRPRCTEQQVGRIGVARPIDEVNAPSIERSAREFAAAAAAAMHQAAPPAGAAAPYRAGCSGAGTAPDRLCSAKRAAPSSHSERPPRPAAAARQQQFDEMTDFRASIKTGPKMPKPVVMVWGLAVLIAVATVLITVLARREAAPPTAAATSPTTASATADAEVQARLMRLLPAGYPTGSCDPGPITAGARAVMSCTANTDASGPRRPSTPWPRTQPRCGRRSTR